MTEHIRHITRRVAHPLNHGLPDFPRRGHGAAKDLADTAQHRQMSTHTLNRRAQSRQGSRHSLRRAVSDPNPAVDDVDGNLHLRFFLRPEMRPGRPTSAMATPEATKKVERHE